MLASLGLVMLSPAIGLIAWRIRRDRDGPILYKGVRVGREGRPFKMYKFRTMVVNADRIGGPNTPDDDARLTGIGRTLRRYKLDELPQLFNVVKGDMSFVGPRPQVAQEVAGYTPDERQLLSVRPGITDWASIRFHNEGEILRGHDDPDRAYAELIRPQKMRLAMEYVRRGTLKDDLQILVATALLPFRHEGRANAGQDYRTVTETWGLPASPEQLAMAYCRYQLAGQLSTGKSVLEVGCGSGMGLAYLKERATRVVGGDPTPELLEEARRHLPGTELVRLSAEMLPFVEASFDVVLMLEMIYYVADIDRAFAEAGRVLRPAGQLLVCLPNRERPDFNPSPFSIRYPSAAELVDLFGRHGFQVRLYGGFPVEPESSRDRRLAGLRRLAVRYHLIPRSMRMKAVLKRILYGPLPRLGAIRDGMASYQPLVEVDGPGAERFKNLYAVGSKTAGTAGPAR